HKVLPPTIKVDQPVETLIPGNGPLYVNTEKRPWMPRASHPRRAAVSAFGFGGSNFHCVLEEHGSEKQQADWDGDVQLIAFSANDLSELKSKLQSWPAPANWSRCRALAAQSLSEFDAKKPHRLVFVAERDKANWSGPLRHLVELLDHLADKPTWSSPE